MRRHERPVRHPNAEVQGRVEATRRAREALAPDGTLMRVEPAASDRVEENLWEKGTHVLGAQGGARLARVCRDAGFSRVRKATQTPFNLIHEARP